MTEQKTLDDYPEVDDYAKTKMMEVAKILNTIQMQYDTRLVAALLAGRAAMLHGMMINAEVMTQDEARAIWKHAGELIENPPTKETKIMKMMDGDVFDPEKVN